MKPPTRRNGLDVTDYLHDESAAFRFQLAGDLSEDGVPDLDQARQTASSVFGGRRLIVDVTGINSIDAASSELLDKWVRAWCPACSHGRGGEVANPTGDQRTDCISWNELRSRQMAAR